jgi:O-antigen/teichoic acid export membrane protein
MTLTPIAVAACLLTPYLLHRFAPAYADASTSFRILTVGAMFMFLNQLSSAFIISLGNSA